jgi:uncharacterized protein (DUF302 family)
VFKGAEYEIRTVVVEGSSNWLWPAPEMDNQVRAETAHKAVEAANLKPSFAAQQDLRPLGGIMSHSYGFSIQAGQDFERALDVTTRELKKQGFGIVSDIDLQAIFKDKLAVDDNRYRILGACNPSIAHQAIRAEPDIGLLLPCNVVVREDKEHFVTVSFTAPEILLALVYRTDLIKLGMEVRERLEKVSAAVLAETHPSSKFQDVVFPGGEQIKDH